MAAMHVGGQEQKDLSPLGKQLFFYVNSSKTKFYCIDPQHGRLFKVTENQELQIKTSNYISIRFFNLEIRTTQYNLLSNLQYSV